MFVPLLRERRALNGASGTLLCATQATVANCFLDGGKTLASYRLLADDVM
jgi:hypothetical protein